MVADVEVLAEHTTQIAAGKEYRAGAAPADQDAFFAEMRAGGADDRLVSNAAKACFGFPAIDFAFAWTESAGIH